MPEVADKTPHQQLIEQKPVQPGTEDLTQVPEDFAGFSKWRAEGGNTEVPETPAPTPEEGKTADVPEPSKAEQEAKDRDDKGRFKPKESDVPVGVQKRIDKAIAKQRDAERRAQELEEQLKKFQAPTPAVTPAPEVKPADGKPKLESFATYEEYVEALVEFKATEKLAAERVKEAEARKQQETEKELTSKQTKWRQSEEASRAKYADFDEALAGSRDDIPQHVLYAVLESDSQSELAYYLAKNGAELQRLIETPVHRIGYEIGKLDAKLASTPAPVAQPKTTQAPPPPSPVQARATGSSFSENDEGGTADEWARKRNEQVYKRRR